ncbi:probable serine/threonine-protein kinase tsuA isoform X2 [Drosophila gunungcola]|uniref:probable serine/threonine-protein kinase tsuA isoform X2 n=1 Tax=Drosophila gunungcola TaxID=103775 RepID=UPI0022DF7999|nr:probable serine/threonine-protein kinase tsuA isoform X2 [Drosophila gunungcola]
MCKVNRPTTTVSEHRTSGIYLSMAATTTTTTTTLATTTGNSTTTNNNNSSNNNGHNNSNNIVTVHAVLNNPPTNIAGGAADAATVAIAKDMLQLHHGAAAAAAATAALNNNNNSNSNNNNSSSGGNSAGSNNNNSGADQLTNSSNNSANHPPATNSTTTSSSSSASSGSTTTPSANASASSSPPYGELRFNQEVLHITDAVTVIGRNSSTSLVHFNVAENNLVSRKHFQVLYDVELRAFFVQCLSKNGIFVDDFLQRRNVDPLRLPQRCYFRFPSTEIRIEFESYVPDTQSDAAAGHSPSLVVSAGGVGGSGAHVIITPPPRDELHQQQMHHHQQQQQLQQHPHHQPPHHQPLQQQQPAAHHPHPHTPHHPLHHTTLHQQQQRSGNIVVAPPAGTAAHLIAAGDGTGIYSPLKISIPKKEQKSPYLSPTGTISAANSCPASPRQGFIQNQPNNYNNYSNNNTQDLFQTPSTASYNHNEKPPYSYAQLIVQAISAAPDKQLTLSGIYSFIVKHYPYYRKETNKGWQNSIRHNLSLNRYFIKVARSQDEPGKGSFWRIDPDSGAKLIDHSYKKRRQRSSQGFRPPYGMPRSAPVSPSHMDNSRESSPLQDIVLQSAPGSPGMSLEQRAADAEIIYNSQNAHQQQQHQQQQQQQTLSSNSNQYSGSPYYVTNQNSGVAVPQALVEGSGASGGGGVGALIALKRNHVMGGGASHSLHQQQAVAQQQPQQQQQQHSEIIYEEMPTDYSGHIEASEEECVTTATDATVAKRPKYVSEVL